MIYRIFFCLLFLFGILLALRLTGISPAFVGSLKGDESEKNSVLIRRNQNEKISPKKNEVESSLAHRDEIPSVPKWMLLSNEEFLKHFEEALALPLSERTGKVYTLVRRAENREFALSKVIQEFGEGQERSCIIRAFFIESDDFAEMERMYARLTSLGDLEAAKRAFVDSGFSDLIQEKRTITQILEERSFLGDLEGLKRGIGKHLLILGLNDKEMSDGSPVFHEIISSERALKEFADLGLSGNVVNELLSESVMHHPFPAWKFMAKMTERDGTVEAAIAQVMIHRNPEEATLLFVKDGATGGHLQAAFDSWLKRDSRRPVKWFEENEQSLDDGERDWIQLGLVQHHAGSEEALGAAKEWAGKIADPEIKGKAEQLLWVSEEKYVLQAVEKEPESIIAAMLKGESAHELHWLENAFGHWIEKDAAAAAQWYEKSDRTLKGEQKQFIAAAYAKEAAAQGDLELARQWAVLIQDEDVAGRVGEFIEGRTRSSD